MDGLVSHGDSHGATPACLEETPLAHNDIAGYQRKGLNLYDDVIFEADSLAELFPGIYQLNITILEIPFISCSKR